MQLVEISGSFFTEDEDAALRLAQVLGEDGQVEWGSDTKRAQVRMEWQADGPPLIHLKAAIDRFEKALAEAGLRFDEHLSDEQGLLEVTVHVEELVAFGGGWATATERSLAQLADLSSSS